MPFLQRFNLNAACLRIFLYSVLVTWRSYTASQAACVHRSIRIYNLALFGFVFLVPLFAIGLFMLALLCVSMVGMSWLEEKDGGSSRAKPVSQSAEPRSIATVASLDEKTLSQLREMEEGHNVGRRKNAGLF
jgi:predicted membrane protein